MNENISFEICEQRGTTLKCLLLKKKGKVKKVILLLIKIKLLTSKRRSVKDIYI